MQSVNMSSFTLDLQRARCAASPRYTPPPTPLRAVLIHGGIMLLWAVLFLRAFGAGGTFAWSIGLAYVGYDTALLFVFLQTLPLRHPSAGGAVTGAGHKFLGLGVIVAAHNEAAVLPVSLTALFAQPVEAN